MATTKRRKKDGTNDEGMEIRVLTTDIGSEWLSDAFDEVLVEEEIPHFLAQEGGYFVILGLFCYFVVCGGGSTKKPIIQSTINAFFTLNQIAFVY